MVQLKRVDHVNDLLDFLTAAVVRIFSFGRWIGTLKLEVFTTFSDHSAIDLPQTITDIYDLVNIGDDLITADDILVDCKNNAKDLETGRNLTL